MSNIKLSVIIPVYNVENYIERNVKSLLENIAYDIEVIYVDDESKDLSCEVLEKYIQGKSNIHLFKKVNSGPGATRNYGLDRANGKYVFFLDSDDYISDISLNKLIDLAERNDLDMLEFCYRLVDENGKELVGPNISKEGSVNKVMTGAWWLRTEKCCSLHVAYFYKREFLLGNNLKMPEGVIHEDFEYVAKCMWYAKRFMKVNDCLYNYVMRPSSIMHTKGKQHRIDSHEGIYRTIDFVKANVDEDTYRDYFEPYIISEFYNSVHIQIQNGENIRKIFRNNPKFREDILEWLKKTKSKTQKVQYFAIRFKLYELYTLMYKIYDKIRPNYLSAR